jgi:chromosome partitioning protein
MKVISISNFKGGVGKSSSCLCVGFALVEKGYKVLMIDADAQSNLSLSLGLDKNTNNHFGSYVLAEKDLSSVVVKISDLLHVIPSSIKAQVYERMLAAENDYQYFLKEKLEEVKGYDFILIDTPPALNAFTYSALVASNYIFIPMQPEIFGVEGLNTIIDTVSRLQKRSNPGLRVGGIFFTKYAQSYRKRIHHDLVDDLKNSYGNLIMNTTIRDNISIAESQAMQQSIYVYAPSSNGAKDYKKLTEELLTRIN